MAAPLTRRARRRARSRTNASPRRLALAGARTRTRCHLPVHAEARVVVREQRSERHLPLRLGELAVTRRRSIEWWRYWQRVLFITFLASFNSCLAIVEYLLHGRRYASYPIHPRPLFVLGHPRTGTTLLHTLLSLHDEEFGICTTLCAGFPSAFLWFERFKGLLAGMVSETRPMDNMGLSLDTPQEDELAVNVLSAGTSPYMPLAFMTAEPSFRPYFSFKAAPAAARERWVRCFRYFLRKVSLRCGGKRLLLKSPVHTGRVALLLQLFPDAQFVYVHRDPLTVFASACHMADTTYWYTYLARPTDAQVTAFILDQFVTLWDEYKADRALVPKGNLHEVAYADLAADPVGEVRRLYAALGLPGFNTLRPRLAAHWRRAAPPTATRRTASSRSPPSSRRSCASAGPTSRPSTATSRARSNLLATF